MHLITIPALTDNYIWLLHDTQHAIIVDPGDAIPVIAYLRKEELQPIAILLTHHHNDHTDGVKLLKEHYSTISVYGPKETEAKGANFLVSDGDLLQLGGLVFSVLSVPGHTLGHVAYHCSPWLFCGDTLFSGGCGRIFEGTAQQMFNSLEKLALLRDDTLICCGHEYTVANMTFASHLLPEDQDIQTYLHKVTKLRQHSIPTLPSLLSVEKRINIFLRCRTLKKSKINLPPNSLTSPENLFATLRELKNKW